MIEIRILSAADIPGLRASLNHLLIDSVAGGASVGFLPPLDPASADKYWLGVEASVRSGHTILAAAFMEKDLAGAVQVSLADKPNAAHRAEIMKLLVLSAARRKGIATQLMRAAENEAHKHGRTLLLLDTERDSAAELLYRRLSWIPLCVIPRYAQSGDGELHDTRLFYKELPPFRSAAVELRGIE